MASMRILLAGAGVISRFHAGALADLSPELLVADPSAAALSGFLEQFPETRAYTSVDAMLAEPARRDDIVVVASPPFTHRDIALQALASGRHVLCEKPLAMNLGEALEMLAAAKAGGLLLGCCSSRFLGVPATERAKQYVDEGRLGRLYHATFVNRRRRSRTGLEYQPSTPWFLDRTRSGGGTLMDWSPYDFTTLNHVLRPRQVEVLSAWMTNPHTATNLPPGAVFDTEQHVGAALRYHRANGETLDIDFERSACTHGGERRITEVEGSIGAVAWEWLDYLGDGSVTLTTDVDGHAIETIEKPTDQALPPIHHRPLVYFVARTLGQPSLAVVNEQAIFNFACLQAVYDCVATGRPQSVRLGDM